MATESPIRILEGTDKWPPVKQSNRYRPSSAKFAIEDLGLFFKSQSFHNFEIDVIPNRSESAPPSMEGSLAAIENIFPQRKSTLNFSGPLKLRETTPTEFVDSSMRFPTNSLSAHEEESEDDRSSEQSLSVPMEKASLCHKSEVDVSDNISSAGISDVSNSSNLETYIHKKQQIIPPNNGLQQQAGPQQDLSTAQIQGSYPQISYPAINHAYGSLNQFHNGSSSASSGFTHPLYATSALLTSPNPFYYQNTQPAGFFTPQYGMGGYTFNSAVLPSYMGGYPVQGVVPVAFNSAFFTPSGNSDMQNVQKFYGQAGFPMQHFADPFQLQYNQPGVRESYGMYGHFGNQTPRNGTVSTPVSPLNSKNKEELVIPSNNHKTQHLNDVGHTNLNIRNGNVSSNYSLGSPTNVGAVYPTGRYKMSHSHSSGSNPAKPYGFQSQSWSDTNSYSFLEELKLGKGQRYELSDIAGYIDEFSVDQHGSRFIQQKLETCSVEEKTSVFKEVLPHTPRLMTDVFGNYVIQKLFEYGSSKQRKELANQLGGQILALSLQMYGCRVIQKALEVIDLDQKTRLVRELDGHVTRCVRDQNGNHVIQKCIESLPSGNINFILSSFRGQVATLSMHPYGCRVIQRVLEHCNDESQMQFVLDEILDSVCSLAQDQYGNYVTQHVLEKGKTRERREIIEKLSRSIVQLSQHKFASNVVEKCLEYSDSTARDVLLKEIVGHGDTNDNLWIMMKDQYANYVIQKILQKCSNDQRVMLLGLIRSHLTALKKYTYGKHIAARFEELYGEEIQSIGS